MPIYQITLLEKLTDLYASLAIHAKFICSGTRSILWQAQSTSCHDDGKKHNKNICHIDFDGHKLESDFRCLEKGTS